MAEKQTEAQAEAAAIRRRWITLGEIVAVAALIISALTFWNSYSERTASEAERAAEKAEEQAADAEAAKRSQTLVLRASASRDGRSLALTPTESGKVIQSLTILFPKALDANAIDAVIEPRIEAGWLDDAVEELDPTGSGDLRLPVAITTRFVSDGETHTDTAIYDIGYRLDRGVLDTDVELRGLALVERAQAKNAQARLDAIWKSRQ
jgi:hypothetical protein